MSQENVELVNRLIAAWNRRDLEAILALTDPDIAASASRLYEEGLAVK